MFKRHVISILLVLVMLFALSACGDQSTGSSSSSDYKAVIKKFYTAIGKADVKGFLNCFEKSSRADILDQMDEDEIKDMLGSIDESYNDEFGDNWVKEYKVQSKTKSSEEDDLVYYDALVTFGEDETEVTLPIVKSKTAYYMHPDVLDQLSGSSSTSKGPQKLAETFFDSISQEDAQKFLNCFTEDMQKSILDGITEEDVTTQLASLNSSLKEQFGDDWRSKVGIGEVTKGDTVDGVTNYTVVCSMEGEGDELTVQEIDGKFYIEDSGLF
ncbi:MAG: hypothetical protein N2376_10005 [Clostridia bacterium]|nr:hypothetical protein [Clostridia bacterium]